MSDIRALVAAKLPGRTFALFFHTDEDCGESSGFVVDDLGRHWSYWTETVDGREFINEWAEVKPEAQWSGSRESQGARSRILHEAP